jgi:BlaI family penicillinase repressor
LRHEEQGRAYIYRAAETARSLAARAVRQIIDRLCNGSVEDLVSGMVEARVLSKAELERLEEFVRDHRKGGK